MLALMALTPDLRSYQSVSARRVLLTKRRHSVEKLAELTGIPYQTVRKHLTGWTVLDAYSIARYARCLNLSAEKIAVLVRAAAVRDWHARPGDRVHPMNGPLG